MFNRLDRQLAAQNGCYLVKLTALVSAISATMAVLLSAQWPRAVCQCQADCALNPAHWASYSLIDPAWVILNYAA
jgi:hypothetical protein